LKLFQKGIDEETFTKLVKEYEQNVYNIALFTVQNEPMAQDITKDVFIKIYKKIGDYRGNAKLSTWIYRITKNTCYNHLKKEKKYKEMCELPLSLSD
jgi:RNA polymerase sigma-70 factor (ECF subfamily)